MLILAQAAQPGPTQLPDIQLDARVSAQRVVVESRGQTSLSVTTRTNGQVIDAGNLVEVQAPQLPAGGRELRNVDVRVRAETRIAAPSTAGALQEPASPQ